MAWHRQQWRQGHGGRLQAAQVAEGAIAVDAQLGCVLAVLVGIGLHRRIGRHRITHRRVLVRGLMLMLVMPEMLHAGALLMLAIGRGHSPGELQRETDQQEKAEPAAHGGSIGARHFYGGPVGLSAFRSV